MENKAISIPTIVLACTAIVISIWQGYETRHHNKLSVKPLLGIRYSVSENHPFIGVWIQNNGYGPAIIKEFIVYLDGQPIKVNSPGSAEKVYQDAKIFFKGVTFWSPAESFILRHGEDINLISYPKDKWTTGGIKMLVEGLNHLRFQFIYESIYGEEFSKSTLEETKKTLSHNKTHPIRQTNRRLGL